MSGLASYSTLSRSRPLRACIIGSGPAGFYTAYRLRTNFPDSQIDIYESLPVPFGLARFGVAPDHPEVKNVTHKFSEVAESANTRFSGNVNVGTDVTLTDLRNCYDVMTFAYGASRNRKLGVPGEGLLQVITARSFVGWYNGLPEHKDLPAVKESLGSAKTAVIIGQGNVALDIARILLESVDNLRHTDIADHALDALARSRVKTVKIIGRRGPLQASFTIKEIRELINLKEVSFLNGAKDMYSSLLSRTSLQRPQKRLLELLAKQNPNQSAKKSWDIEYQLSPKSFDAKQDKLASITMTQNELKTEGGRTAAIPTVNRVTIPAELAFTSIGYQSEALPGMSEIGIVFDTTRHILPNTAGRVTSLDGIVAGMYCAGWAKNGPIGVIASTMRDAFETADAITHDWNTTLPDRELDDIESVLSKLKTRVQIIDWEAWKRIEAIETQNGKECDPSRPARKIVDIDEMLKMGA